MWMSVIRAAMEVVLSWVSRESEESAKSKAKAAEAAIESVCDSVNAEKEMEEERKNVKDSGVVKDDGSLDLTDWNDAG